MKAKPSLEQALCIVAFLGIQDRQIPLHSSLVAERLDISTSYLKKIVQRLAAGKIVKTVSGRVGGIVLTRNPHDITLLDIFDAIEGPQSFVKNTGLVKRLFDFEQRDQFMRMYGLKNLHGEQSVANVLATFGAAEKQYRQQLATLSIGDILPSNGSQPLELDWTTWLTR